MTGSCPASVTAASIRTGNGYITRLAASVSTA